MKRRKAIRAKVERELQMVRRFEEIVTKVKEESLGPRKATNRIKKDLRNLLDSRSTVERMAIVTPLLDAYKEEVTTYLQLIKTANEMAGLTETTRSVKLIINIHRQRLVALDTAFIGTELSYKATAIYLDEKYRILGVSESNKKE